MYLIKVCFPQNEGEAYPFTIERELVIAAKLTFVKELKSKEPRYVCVINNNQRFVGDLKELREYLAKYGYIVKKTVTEDVISRIVSY